MNPIPTSAVLALRVGPVAFVNAPLVAQTAPNSTTRGEEAVVLSPFTVESGTEKGYLADVSGNGNDFINLSTQYVTRGGRTSVVAQDFFANNVPPDRFNSEAFTFTRDPNAILLGLGNPAGAFVSYSKRAKFKTATALEFRTDNNESYRVSVDRNQVIAKDRLALRYAGLYEDANGYRLPSGSFQRRHYATLTFTPFKGTTLRVNYEQGHLQLPAIRPWPVYDSVSPWLAAGLAALNSISADARRTGCVILADTASRCLSKKAIARTSTATSASSTPRHFPVRRRASPPRKTGSTSAIITTRQRARWATAAGNTTDFRIHSDRSIAPRVAAASHHHNISVAQRLTDIETTLRNFDAIQNVPEDVDAPEWSVNLIQTYSFGPESKLLGLPLRGISVGGSMNARGKAISGFAETSASVLDPTQPYFAPSYEIFRGWITSAKAVRKPRRLAAAIEHPQPVRRLHGFPAAHCGRPRRHATRRQRHLPAERAPYLHAHEYVSVLKRLEIGRK